MKTRLLLLAGSSLFLAASAPAAEPNVVTHATARERLPNTVADVVLAVETRGRTVAEVQTGMSTGTTSLLAFLGGARVARLRSQGVTVQPEIDYSPGAGQRVLGYKGRATVSFQVEAARMGEVIGPALSQGANAIDSASAHPRVEETDGARQRLAVAATKIALEQARAVAEAAGLKAGMVQGILVDPAGAEVGLPVMYAPAPVMAAARATPIATEAGDTEVTARVTVTVTLAAP